MGFKYLMVSIIALAVFTLYFVGGAVDMSTKMETYAVQQLKAEKWDDEKFMGNMIFNIKYTMWTAKYDRSLELIEKYKERYEIYEQLDEVSYLEARTFDRMMEEKPAFGLYKQYIENYPEGKYIKQAKERASQLNMMY